MKRGADNDMGIPQKRSRAGDDEVRLLIPSKVAGSIIGRGGQNITKLRSQYKASITVPDCPGPERLLNLSSDLDTLCNIIRDVIPHLEENDAKTNDGNIDLRMMVHQSQAGCIIGKGGNKIKELREKTGARIKIFSNVAPQSTDRVVQIIGEGDQCVETVREIILLIKESPLKGAVNNYNPHNFDEFYAEEYGGWGGNKSGGGGDRRGGGGGLGGGGGPRGGLGGSSGGFQGGNNRNGPPSRFNSRPSGGGGLGNTRGGPPPFARPFDSRPPTSRFGGGDNGGGLGLGGGLGGSRGGLGNNGFPSSRNSWSSGGGGLQERSGLGGPPPIRNSGFGGMRGPLGGGSSLGGGGNSTQVTIPKDLAGAIIGKGGGRIRKIRQESGASITIDEALPGSDERIITITGEPSQIQMAQYLLQQSVHNNSDNF